MLSGIRKGKKKKRTETADNCSNKNSVKGPSLPPAESATSNQSMADQLRQQLASGGNSSLLLSSSSSSAAVTVATSLSKGTVVDHLQHRGRIQSAIPTATATSSTDNNHKIVFTPGIKKSTTTTNNNEESMTIQELVAQERQQQQYGMAWDEQMSRNAIRLGKKRRRNNNNNNNDSDDELEQLQTLLPTSKPTKQKQLDKHQQRLRHYQMNVAKQTLQQEQKVLTSKCPWWIESSNFVPHRLLAMGNHVSLIMAPPNRSITMGEHFYLVPIPYCNAMVNADENDIWKEVFLFQQALQQMYQKDEKGVLLMETALLHRSKGIWQTKLEVIILPMDKLQDAPMHFQSSIMEQVQHEIGGNSNNLMHHIHSQTKPLQATIPKDKFSYFMVDWSSAVTTSKHTGVVLMIENDSTFDVDFGMNVLTGMLERDPIRFQKHVKYSVSQEKETIAKYLNEWKNYDWTVQLDEEK